MDAVTIVFWIFCAIIGGAIGFTKGRAASGIIWGGLLGPVGIIVILCLPNLKKQKEAETGKQLMEQQLRRQRAQIEQLKKDRLSAAPPPPSYQTNLRIASNGQDLGELPVATVKLMLQTGKLTPQDYYFDVDCNDWMQLDCCNKLGSFE